MSRNLFIDPVNGATYTWAVNHRTEEVNGRQREITQLHPVGAGWAPSDVTSQQGETTPRKMRLGGRAFTIIQHSYFLIYYYLCRTQTVLFHHGADDVTYEVLVTAYEFQRRAVTRAPRGDAHVFDYTMELEIVAEVTP